MKIFLMVVLLIMGLFFATRWTLEKEREKGSQPSFLRGMIIPLAAWVWVAINLLIKIFDRETWKNRKLEVIAVVGQMALWFFKICFPVSYFRDYRKELKSYRAGR